MMSFSNAYPFHIKSISNVPLFDIQNTQIIYPIGLDFDIKGSNEFYIGFGLADCEMMDIIAVTKSEAEDYFNKNIQFTYPAKLYRMQQTPYKPKKKYRWVKQIFERIFN